MTLRKFRIRLSALPPDSPLHTALAAAEEVEAQRIDAEKSDAALAPFKRGDS